MADAKTDGDKAHAPPYVAFSTTKTLLGMLKEHGVPGRIDRSVLGNFSGQVGGQLITALRFLSLIDPDSHPTPDLIQLVNAYGTDNWPQALSGVLHSAYKPLTDSNLASATPAQFNDRFRSLYPAEGDTLRKCMTFFLSAAKEAGVSISPYIMKNKKPRTAPTRRKAKSSNGIRENGDGEKMTPPAKEPDPPFSPPPPPPSAPQTAAQVLVAMLDHEMEPSEQQAVFTLLLYLKKPKKNGGTQ